ncbi:MULTISPECIES: cyclic-di-AMP-binding protein CbpB [unclassified Enterococcus]|uniref:cyclic-di-AMP-binding protein CbpB n=1 Tax=unclassified Enterococcus TaxID=2608891 RepID=UPI00155408D4|nr:MULTISPECIES: cyclic-di-AMP-binding protein CbpB [unclassified Enterococcus]MBS7576771.1 CBS domain-containing protein [Enterococcus sp. MMGLQ5-2]MBS7583742.1 CBS domain-containing protein [Enterococcus sp. MMGLQ5-1]NPD11603.1 CBS domain-containing protein [Enterococcus sp. MMGLQ5-1]NPD36608.1 CBS domain-containing protein [Enterococcus sp. MMGLQ5-2]
MVDKAIEKFLLAQQETFLIPMDNVAIFVDTNKLNHAVLVLSKNKYAKIPVVDKDEKFVGIVGLTEIISFMLENNLSMEELANYHVLEVVKEVNTVNPDYTLEEILHHLVDEPFLPVVAEDNMFIGIITRKELLKAVNALAHEFDKEYIVLRKKELVKK